MICVDSSGDVISDTQCSTNTKPNKIDICYQAPCTTTSTTTTTTTTTQRMTNSVTSSNNAPRRADSVTAFITEASTPSYSTSTRSNEIDRAPRPDVVSAGAQRRISDHAAIYDAIRNASRAGRYTSRSSRYPETPVRSAAQTQERKQVAKSPEATKC